MMKNVWRTTCLGIGLILGWGGARPALAQQPSRIQELVKQVLLAETNLTLTGTEVVEEATPEGVQRSLRKVHRWAGMQRIEYLEPPFRRGLLLLDNGQLQARFDPRTKTISLRSSPPRLALARRLIEFLRTNRIDLQGDDEVAGRAAWVVDVQRRRPEAGWQRVWIDRQTFAQLRTDVYDERDHLVSSTYFQDISYLRQIPFGLFEITPPPRAQILVEGEVHFKTVAQAQPWVPFPIRQPSYLPPEVKLFDVRLDMVEWGAQSRLRITLLYSAEKSPVMLFETVFSRGGRNVPREPKRQKPGLYTWTDGQVLFVLIGRDLPDQELERMARSVKGGTKGN